MNRSIITVVVKDGVGIIAKICAYLADNKINILDITQTIVSDFFNMMMICDASTSDKDFQALAKELEEIGDSINCIIKIQREEIFYKMQRI